MPSYKELADQLEKTQGWTNLTAYERTKRCCAELTKRGERIPSWLIVRDIIGKGSSNDINRAKEDFRQEQGAALRKMSGFADGIPLAIANHMQGLWFAAIDYADSKFETQAKAWQEQIALSEAAVSKAENDRDHALASAAELTEELLGLKNLAATLKTEAASERMGKERAERLLAASQTELAAQKEKLILALENAQKELSNAISRLEGAENHALMEAERVRSDCLNKLESLETAYGKEKIKMENNISRLESKLQNQSANEMAARQKISLLEKERNILIEHQHRSERLLDKLTEENAQLIAVIARLKAEVAAKT